MKRMIVVSFAAALLFGGLAGCSTNSEDSNNSTSQSTSQTSSQTSTNFKVSVADAIKAYQEAYPESDITAIDLETSLGKYLYKIEGVGDNQEYEIRVNADTKAVSKEREEVLDADEKDGVKRKEDTLDLENLLSIEKVSALAVEHVGSGEATDWSLDKELGTTYWEVKVKDGQKETEVKLDAQSGAVLESEVDD